MEYDDACFIGLYACAIPAFLNILEIRFSIHLCLSFFSMHFHAREMWVYANGKGRLVTTVMSPLFCTNLPGVRISTHPYATLL